MRSLEIAKEIDDDNIIGRSLKNIGGTYWEKGDLDIALDYYINALEAFQRLGKDHHGHHGVFACLNDIGYIYYEKGNYDKALDYQSRSLRMLEEPGDKYWVGSSLGTIGTIYYNKRNYNIAVEYLDKSLSIKKEIGLGADALIWTTTHLYLAYKHLGKEYDVKKIQTLVENAEDIEFELNYRLYQLLEDTSYLETAYNQIQEEASALDDELKAKFLSYPIPKAIVEEWEKVK
jgi:tetratricopeptide (TPR) repeat protein